MSASVAEPKSIWKDLPLEVRGAPIRSTARGRLHTCPRKFLFEERLGLVPNTYNAAFDIGDVFHAMVAPLYSSRRLPNLESVAKDKVREVSIRLEKVVDETGMLPNGKTFGEQIDEVEKDVLMAGALAEAFSSLMPVDKLLDNYEVISVEECYVLVIEGRSFVIQPDVLLRHKKTGALWIVDHKTFGGKRVSQRIAVCPYEFQPRFYKWVLSQVREEAIGGVIHNVVKKPTIRLTKKETLEEYIARVKNWLREQATLDPNDPPVQQSVVRHVGSFEPPDLKYQIAELREACEAEPDLARFYREEKSCFGMFGNQACAFLRLCQNENRIEEWPAMISGNFIQAWRSHEDTK